MARVSKISGLARLISILLLLVSLFVPGVIAVRFSNSLESSDLVEVGSDLTGLLTTGGIFDQKIFHQARNLLQGLQTAPSCNQLALLRLVGSCKSINSEDGGDMTEIIERSKSVYAVRAAICETSEGEAPVPAHCRTILTSSVSITKQPSSSFTFGKSKHEVEVISSRELAPCVKALQKDSIYWTSYSNNRQHAAVMCEAMRYPIDRQELVDLHTRLTDVTEAITKVLAETRQKAAEDHTAQLSRAEDIRHSQEQHLETLTRDHQASRAMIKSLMDNFDLLTKQAHVKMNDSLREAGRDMNQIQAALQDSIPNLVMLQAAIARTYQTAASGIAEFAASQLHDFQNSHELATQTQDAIKQMKIFELSDMTKDILSDIAQFQQNFKDLQNDQLDKANLQLELSEKTIEKQHAGLSLANRTVDSISGIHAKVGDIESFLGKTVEIFALLRSGQAFEIVVLVSAFIVIGFFTRPTIAIVALAFYVVSRATLGISKRFAVAVQAFLPSFLATTVTAIKFLRSVSLKHRYICGSLAAVIILAIIYTFATLHRHLVAIQVNNTLARQHTHFDRNTRPLRYMPVFPTQMQPAEKDRFKRSATAPPRFLSPITSPSIRRV